MMKKEYIEREAAVAALHEKGRQLSDGYYTHLENGGFTDDLVEVEIGTYSAAENIVKAIPSADVVEVVRCKDCKKYGMCPIAYFHLKTGNGYCSDGIAKMDGKGDTE